jgi:type II secretory pathway component PulF
VAIHFLLSLPMRRRDRALFFLDLVETVLQRGQPLEPAILAAAENHDRAIGVRFYMMAAHIEGGARLGEALEKEPRFLPPQVNAMFRAGEKLGDLKKVLPACREVLRVAPDTVRSTTHYMVAILLIFAPAACVMITLLSTFVIPKFKDVFAGMGIQIWPLALFVFDLNRSHVLVGFEPLVSIPQRAGGGLDHLAHSVETEKIAARLFRHAGRAARRRRAGSRSRAAGRRCHGQ